MKNRLRFLMISLVLLLIGACADKSPDVVQYHKPKETYADSTLKWLAKSDNFNNPGYYPVFKAYYTEKIAAADYLKAAQAFDNVTSREMYFQFFNVETIAALKSFNEKYGGNVPWNKMLFYDSYLGNYDIENGEYRKAIAHFKKVSKHVPFDYHSCVDIAHARGDAAYCYSAMGEHDLALQNNLKALELFNRTDNLTGQGGIYDNMGLAHLYTQNYGEAELYFDKSMNSFRLAGDTANMFIALHNKILLYQETENPLRYDLIDSTYRFFLDTGSEDKSMKIAISSFYVDMLIHTNRLAEAEAILKEMKRDVDMISSPISDADYNITFAAYEVKAKSGVTDIGIIEKALAASEEKEDYRNQQAFSEALKEDAEVRKDYSKALMYAEKEKDALKKAITHEMIVQTSMLNKKHQTEKKEQQIVLQKNTILSKNIAIALLITVLLVFFLIVITVYLRQKQKKNLIEAMRVRKYTRQLLEKTEEERKRIAGDLHDSVSHELLNLKNIIGPGETGQKIDMIINDIRVISRNLHPIMFEKVGLAASVQQLVERAQSIYDLMVTTEIDYNSSLSTSDELQVYRIIQEALTNTIKYAGAVAAKIVLLSDADRIFIEIKDNGKGFDQESKLSGSSAFGLHNILERSKAIGGLARINSDNNGTVITVEIKKQ